MCFAISSSFVLAGNRPACNNNPPRLTCNSPAVRLDPGTCVEITNPCDNHQWVRLDVFRLCDQPAGLFVQSQRNPRTRFICADPSIAALVDEPVEFFYSRPGEAGVGTLRVTVGATPLVVNASATPPTISSGGSSQLNATVSGGIPPYSYSWEPSASLSGSTLPNPVATPAVSTQYTVVVTDSTGVQAGAAVIVNVGLSATASANPPAIDPGQSSNLSVQVIGGTPPYTYDWTPAGLLSSPNVDTPIAFPTVTTTYNVTVTDFFGATAIASVTLTVNLSASASANPGSVSPGAQSQLDVAVSGGLPPYTFSWSPAASLDNPMARNPIATPNETTTYDVIVTDSLGQQTSASATVDVTPPSVTACFTVTLLGNGVAAQGDATCSTGPIVQYRWWSDFLFPTQPPTAVTTTPVSPIFGYEGPGPKTMRLEVIDAMGGSSATTQTFTTN